MVILREESYLTEAIRPLIQNLADLQEAEVRRQADRKQALPEKSRIGRSTPSIWLSHD